MTGQSLLFIGFMIDLASFSLLDGFQIRTHIKMFRCNRVNGCCIAWWSIFSFLICYYSSYVSPYYEIPVSCDPIIYHLMGRGMMEGLMPYRDLFDQKGPFIFLIYGFSYTLCGSYWLVFVLEVFAVTASMIFCYKAALLFVSGKKAFIVSLLILYSMCSFHYYAGGGHPSEFILPFQFAAIYGVCRLYRDPDRFVRTGVVFGAGIGMALLLKFNLAAFWFVPFLYVLYRARMTGKAWIFTGSVGGTLLLMLTPCLWYFYSRGALLDLYEGYIVFNAGYGADAVSFKEMCRNYSQWVKRDIMYPSMLMYIVGGAGVILSRMPAREKIYYTAAFLITCMGVQGNGKTHFNHYAQTLIPFAAVGYLVVARMIHVEEVVSRKWRRWLFPLVVAGVMACTFLNCVDFSCRSRAREWMSAFALPDTSDEPGGGECLCSPWAACRMVLLCQWFGAAHTHVYDLRFRQTGCRTGKDASVSGNPPRKDRLCGDSGRILQAGRHGISLPEGYAGFAKYGILPGTILFQRSDELGYLPPCEEGLMPQFFHDAFCKSPGRVGRGSRKFPEPLFAFQPGALPFGVLPGGEGQLDLAVFTGDFPAQHASYQCQAQGAFRCGGAWARKPLLHAPPASCVRYGGRFFRPVQGHPC